jgi:hypothetical protein
MDNPAPAPVLPNGIDVERLIAEYREEIVKLEAHGLPAEHGALWDVLGDILAEIRRCQPESGTEGAPPA